MAITNSQQFKQLLAQGGRIGLQGGGKGMSGVADSQGNVGVGSGDGKGPDDRGTAEQNRNQRAQVRAGRVRALENFIDRPTVGFTDAAKTNLLSPSSLAKTAFGKIVGIPGLSFLSNIGDIILIDLSPSKKNASNPVAKYSLIEVAAYGRTKRLGATF